MSKSRFCLLIFTVLMFSTSVFAVDGVVLINQASVMAAGGFPYTINQSGSYRLSGNLAVPSGVDGIDINASNVTLDLNGFMISGPGNSGIFAGGGGQLTIRNGTVTGFGGGGIAIDSQGGLIDPQGGAVTALIEGIQAQNNSVGIAFLVGSGGAILRRNVAFRNSIGIECNASCVVTDNVANNNAIGIFAVSSTITGNVANSNSQVGLYMLSTGLFGSNTLEGNGTASVDFPGLSQLNNDCNGSPC